jgi:hypothetical protein
MVRVDSGKAVDASTDKELNAFSTNTIPLAIYR